MSVIKRNGRVEAFNIEKIVNAARKAYQACNAELSKDVENQLRGLFTDKEVIGIEEIQDAVEKILMKDNPEFAKAFIIYRYKHKRTRDFVKGKINFINRYKGSNNTANATVDDNSNVNGKNIGILNAEIHKEDNINVSRGMIMNKLKELYPEFNSKQYIKDLESHIIYKHDESGFAGAISPYCCSISMYPFLIGGIKEIGGLSAAPQNIDSYCGMYVNLIFAVSAQFAGAVATSEFLLYFDYFARKEWGDDYYLKPDIVITSEHSLRQKTIQKQIHQYFQQVV
jgi:ribonucleoside-triphosphate reductase